MKKFTIGIFLLLATTAQADLGLVGRSVAKNPATGLSLGGNSEKFFVNAKNVSNASMPVGSVMVTGTIADDGYSVTTSVTAGAFVQCVYEEVCAVNDFCSCQTYGVADVLTDVDANIATAGQQAFISESTAGYAQPNPLGSIAAGDVYLGVFLDSDSNPGTSGLKQVFLRLR